MKVIDNYLDKILKVEFVAVPGFGKGIEELTLDGKKIYTSRTLKNNVKKSIKKSAPKLSNKISKLIDDGTIIPAFRSKNIVQYLTKKPHKGRALGTTRGNKIYIFLEAIYARFKITSVDEKMLSSLIIHELMHLIEFIKPIEFRKINYKLISEFYKEFFRNYLNITKNIDNDIVNGILLRQMRARKTKITDLYKMYTPTFKELRPLSQLDDDEYQIRYDILLEFLDENYVGFTKYIPSTVFNAAKKTYIKIAGKPSDTLAQEFWCPGEIIAVVSHLNLNHPSVQKTLNIL